MGSIIDLLPPVSLLEETVENFQTELKEATQGRNTSLAFVRNKLSLRSQVLDGESFEIMAIGGSVGHKALAVKRKESVRIDNYQTSALPRFVTKEDVFRFFEKNLFEDVRVVALNFAYPLQPLQRMGRLDGKLFRATKEHLFRGLIGKSIGQELEEYMLATQKRHIEVNVANDVVCLVLSGLLQDINSNLAGGIVGYGMNIGFFLDEHTVVNLESGNFDEFVQTVTGKAIDEDSQSPGKQRFEKEVAGSYLYLHFNRIVEQEDIMHVPLSSTKELDTVAQKEKGIPSEIAKKLLERSASLLACQIAGIYFFKKRPLLTFVMEGSVFWKGWQYKECVGKYLLQLGVPKGGIRFVHIDKSTIVGAAKLVA